MIFESFSVFSIKLYGHGVKATRKLTKLKTIFTLKIKLIFFSKNAGKVQINLYLLLRIALSHLRINSKQLCKDFLLIT